MPKIWSQILISVCGFIVGFCGSYLVRKWREARDERDKMKRKLDDLKAMQEDLKFSYQHCMDHFNHLDRRVSHLNEMVDEIKKKEKEDGDG